MSLQDVDRRKSIAATSIHYSELFQFFVAGKVFSAAP